MRTILLLAVVGTLALPAAAQTGRIAQGSHAGRAPLTAADDNLGLSPTSFWKADTLVYVNDSTVLHKGSYSRGYHPPTSQTAWHRQVEVEESFRYYYRQGAASRAERIEALRREYPQATFVGFERQPTPKKPSGRIPVFRKRPFQYSYWRGLATVAALGAVGWRLGRKAKTA